MAHIWRCWQEGVAMLGTHTQREGGNTLSYTKLAIQSLMVIGDVHRRPSHYPG